MKTETCNTSLPHSNTEINENPQTLHPRVTYTPAKSAKTFDRILSDHSVIRFRIAKSRDGIEPDEGEQIVPTPLSRSELRQMLMARVKNLQGKVKSHE